MTSSIVLFGIFIILYGVMIEIFTVLFQLTGITREKARMQVISLLTNCGFTTAESEIIMSAKRRRRLAQITMLCGYSFAVLIVSLLVNVFSNMKQAEIKSLLVTIVPMTIVVVLYFLLMKIKKIRQSFNLLIEKLGNRIMFGKQSNVLILIDMVREKALAETTLINLPTCLHETKLSESNLKEAYGIQILYVKRNGESLEMIDGDTIVRKGDTLLLFGDYKKIRLLFERPEG